MLEKSEKIIKTPKKLFFFLCAQFVEICFVIKTKKLIIKRIKENNAQIQTSMAHDVCELFPSLLQFVKILIFLSQ